MLQTIKNLIRYKAFNIPAKPSGEAYDMWADDYDDQPDNLMFHLDRSVFLELISSLNVNGKNVADIGCGTGRHWPFLFQNRVGDVTGYDVSDGMLERLKLKFPDAHTVKVDDVALDEIEDNTYDLIISTLTVAHIEPLEQAMTEWCKVLKPGGDIIITDIHPKALASGGKHVFQHQNESIPILNYVHPTEFIIEFFKQRGFAVAQQVVRLIDNTLMHFYIKQNAMHVYQKFRGTPMLYGLHLKKA